MAEIAYTYLKKDGSESKPVGLTALRLVAAARLVVGGGPFSGTFNGKDWFTGKSRLTALNKLPRACTGAEIGDVMRIRNGKGNIILVVRAVLLKPQVDPRRATMVKWARWMISHEGSIHYSQARPIPQYAPGHLPETLDCSGSTITLCRWAGIPDPSGGSYADGSTDTLLANARKIERRELQIGDMCLWAIGADGKHVAVVIELGDDPLLESHGQEAGPMAIRLSAEDRYHASETVHYLSIT